MSFLVDTDICSAYIKQDNAVVGRFVQYGGRLSISTVTLGELRAWALRASASPRRVQALGGLLAQVSVLPVDEDVAERFGEVRAWQLDRGLATPDLDLLNGAVALTHGLTLSTHNTQDYLERTRTAAGRLARAVIRWLDSGMRKRVGSRIDGCRTVPIGGGPQGGRATGTGGPQGHS